MNTVAVFSLRGRTSSVIQAAPPLITKEFEYRNELHTDYTSTDWVVMCLKDTIGQDRWDVAVYDEGRVVAVGSITPPEDDIHRRKVSYVIASVVHPDYRGLSVARTLYRALQHCVPNAEHMAITKRVNQNEYHTRYRRINNG